jgi:hypothetical protein
MGEKSTLTAAQKLDFIMQSLVDMRRDLAKVDATASLAVNYCQDIARRLIADSTLSERIRAAETIPVASDEEDTQPDLAKPSEDA